MDSTAPITILAGIGLTPRLSAVAFEALAIADRLGGRVCFVHAGEDKPATRTAVEAGLADLPYPAVARELVIRPGRPDRVLSAEAKRIGARLLVAGALEKEGLLADLLGSTARRLARQAPCSVLLLPHPSMAGSRFERVMVGVNHDQLSRSMLAFTAQLCMRSGVHQMRVVSEYDAIRLEGSLAPNPQDLTESDAEWRNAELSSLMTFLEGCDLGDVVALPEVLEAREGGGVVLHAQRLAMDLLVMTAPASGMSLLDRFFRQHTEIVLQQLPCALLLYRQSA